ncbi:MAG: hypothetical protein AB7G62_02440 [Magnetospirillum sp.]
MAVSSTSSSVSASTVTETVYPVMVNGYLCYSAAEVAAVKSGQSPDSVKPGYTSEKSDENTASQNQSAAQVRSSTQTQSQAEIQAQAQAKQLAQAQARVAQFNQLSEDERRQQQEDSRRGQLVDFYA